MLAIRGQPHFGLGNPAIGVDDEHILRQERRRYGDGVMQQSTWIVPEVEHQPLQVAVLVQILQCLDQILARTLLELTDVNPAVAWLHHFRLDALHIDDLARHGERERVALALAQHAQHDLAARRALHLLDRLGQRQAADLHVVDAIDLVAGEDARAGGRLIFHRRDDLDQTVFHVHFDAETAITADGVRLQVLERFFVEKLRVRIEAGDHPVDGFADEFLVRDGFDVICLDLAEHIGQHAQIVERQTERCFAIGDGREVQRQHDAGRDPQSDQPRLFPKLSHISTP